MNTQKRKKDYYQKNGNNLKKHKQFSLEIGMTGFLCTCNFREKDCVRDAYKLLSEFADEIYGSHTVQDSDNDNTKVSTTEQDDSVNSKTEQDDEKDDISTALNKEINELRAEYKKPIAARRFQAVDTGVKNVIFIKSTLPDPLELVTKIVTELDKTKQQRTRYLLRLLPIEVVCKAYMDDIKLKADVVLEKYFAQEPKTFSIVFNRHCNNNIHRDEVIEDLAEIINKKNPGNKADLKNPELAVIVEVIRGICLISIAPNYYKFKKYNLLEICNIKEPTNSTKKTNSEKDKDSKGDEKDSEENANLPEDTTDNKETSN
ncbi:THUMP domain-containing protein 1 homolog [Colletes gigas]|uniref:THUMP domain-containing protein 1 homolog n=1 Tax=Colletes gigas TaxID=935657 RepID=UPI001C9B5437|nr:THUMP domain-containing protein 1 homolog [Colletes gigas]XP_043248502.1 THUMP domain-containing protein 1 homolog [Colletes gigas]XP_043248503.1 THUMP domain-containing protein 1 homolog [Colletes gigas]